MHISHAFDIDEIQVVLESRARSNNKTSNELTRAQEKAGGQRGMKGKESN